MQVTLAITFFLVATTSAIFFKRQRPEKLPDTLVWDTVFLDRNDMPSEPTDGYIKVELHPEFLPDNFDTEEEESKESVPKVNTLKTDGKAKIVKSELKNLIQNFKHKPRTPVVLSKDSYKNIISTVGSDSEALQPLGVLASVHKQPNQKNNVVITQTKPIEPEIEAKYPLRLSYQEPLKPVVAVHQPIRPSKQDLIRPAVTAEQPIRLSYQEPSTPVVTPTQSIRPSYQEPANPVVTPTQPIRPSYQEPLKTDVTESDPIRPSYREPLKPVVTEEEPIRLSYQEPLKPAVTTSKPIRPSYQEPIKPVAPIEQPIRLSYQVPLDDSNDEINTIPSGETEVVSLSDVMKGKPISDSIRAKLKAYVSTLADYTLKKNKNTFSSPMIEALINPPDVSQLPLADSDEDYGQPSFILEEPTPPDSLQSGPLNYNSFLTPELIESTRHIPDGPPAPISIGPPSYSTTADYQTDSNIIHYSSLRNPDPGQDDEELPAGPYTRVHEQLFNLNNYEDTEDGRSFPEEDEDVKGFGYFTNAEESEIPEEMMITLKEFWDLFASELANSAAHSTDSGPSPPSSFSSPPSSSSSTYNPSTPSDGTNFKVFNAELMTHFVVSPEEFMGSTKQKRHNMTKEKKFGIRDAFRRLSIRDQTKVLKIMDGFRPRS